MLWFGFSWWWSNGRASWSSIKALELWPPWGPPQVREWSGVMSMWWPLNIWSRWAIVRSTFRKFGWSIEFKRSRRSLKIERWFLPLRWSTNVKTRRLIKAKRFVRTSKGSRWVWWWVAPFTGIKIISRVRGLVGIRRILVEIGYIAFGVVHWRGFIFSAVFYIGIMYM